jgi:DNA recombination-dependent growth factor C
VGFFSANISFTRYHLVDPIEASLWPEIPGRLKAHGFRDIDASADERSFGWCCFEDMLDSAWKGAPPEKGVYLAFGLRLDTRRIAPAVMKKHLTLALESYRLSLAEQGRKAVSREEKEEIKDQVRLKLMARSLPIPAVFDVVWNTQTGRILLGSTRDKIQEMFEELFFHTFGIRAVPLLPYFLARQALPEGRRKGLEEIEGTVFV